MITELKENEIFVFGSNANGSHGGGAAYQAKKSFGAVDGIGVGLTGQCYAFPTLDEDYNKYTLSQIKQHFIDLYKCCEDNKDKVFLLTKVGCGIAGYNEQEILDIIPYPLPNNLVFPVDWQTKTAVV